MTRIIVAILSIVAVLVLGVYFYNFDAFSGQREFERLCKTEGGLRIYEPVEKNVGWYVEERPEGLNSYTTVFWFEHVAFVRWKNKDGETFDVYRKPGPPMRNDLKLDPSQFVLLPVNRNNEVKYQYIFQRVELPDSRFGRDQKIIINLSTDRRAAVFTQFHYKWTSPEHVILNAPTGVSCHITYEDRQAFSRDIFNFGTK